VQIYGQEFLKSEIPVDENDTNEKEFLLQNGELSTLWENVCTCRLLFVTAVGHTAEGINSE